MKGFFSQSSIISKPPISTLSLCGMCGLYKQCKSPKMPVTGKGKKGILFVAEAPGKQEDKKNTQLIGKAGKYLRRILDRHCGIDLDRDCWKTNAIICRPPDNKIENDMIEACRPNLLATIKQLKPTSVILLGGSAMRSLVGYLWKDKPGAVSTWVGYNIPNQKPNMWVSVTYHPSYLIRGLEGSLAEDVFIKHLKRAIKKSKKRPWKTVPSIEDGIECYIEPSRAAKRLEKFLRKNKWRSFDFETNCIRPEGEGPKIVCCSVSDGKRTLSFPWTGKVVELMVKFFKDSKQKKIGANIKFEDRWSRVRLGHRVKGWIWDTMIAAHIIDHRPGITGLKFQSFIQLGVPIYDAHIKFLLEEFHGRFNRIDEIDLMDLLMYCGIDSKCTYRVAIKQMKILEKRK